MKKYIIICSCLVCIITIGMLLFLGANYSQARHGYTQAMLENAIKTNELHVAEIKQYTLWMMDEYNIAPNISQLSALVGQRFRICHAGQVEGAPLPKDEQYTWVINKSEIHVTHAVGDDLYLLGVYTLELEQLYHRHLTRAISMCLCLFTFLSAIFTIIGIVVYFSNKKLIKAMNAMTSGDYGIRIKGGKTAQSFNDMASSVKENVIAANAAAQSQRDFVANFSHELKTPLTAIIGYADLLRSAELDQEDAFTAASYIFSEGKRLESLSLKLMDMIVLDKQSFELRPLPASKLLQHIAITVRPMLSNAMLTLEFHAAAARIEGERDLIITLVMNLLDNARKASPEGGKIILRGTVEGDRYKISIKDHGRGIPKEELGRITEAFYMVDKSRARAQHGAGLGLALSQRIAQMHGSSLEFISQEGEGTEVSFSVKRLLKTKELADEN